MYKVIVDRSKWIRGQTALSSYLRRQSDGKMCCVGFVCLALGLKEQDISGKKSVYILPVDIKEALYPKINFNKSHLDDPAFDPFDEAYAINDEEAMKESSREGEITRLGKDLGLDFIFVDQGWPPTRGSISSGWGVYPEGQ